MNFKIFFKIQIVKNCIKLHLLQMFGIMCYAHATRRQSSVRELFLHGTHRRIDLSVTWCCLKGCL